MQRKFTYGFWKNGIHYEIYDVIDEINFENTKIQKFTPIAINIINNRSNKFRYFSRFHSIIYLNKFWNYINHYKS